jgi:hypothetical protein
VTDTLTVTGPPTATQFASPVAGSIVAIVMSDETQAAVKLSPALSLTAPIEQEYPVVLFFIDGESGF